MGDYVIHEAANEVDGTYCFAFWLRSKYIQVTGLVFMLLAFSGCGPLSSCLSFFFYNGLVFYLSAWEGGLEIIGNGRYPDRPGKPSSALPLPVHLSVLVRLLVFFSPLFQVLSIAWVANLSPYPSLSLLNIVVWSETSVSVDSSRRVCVGFSAI